MASNTARRSPACPRPLQALALAATFVAFGADLPVAATESANRQAQVAGIERMTIRLKIAGQRPIEAMLLDVPAAWDFAALLPLTLTLTDHAATEKISELPRKLTTAGAPEGFEPKAGDIAFYAPWGNLAIFYKGFHHSPGLVRLATITTAIERFAVPGPMRVTIERAD